MREDGLGKIKLKTLLGEEENQVRIGIRQERDL